MLLAKLSKTIKKRISTHDIFAIIFLVGTLSLPSGYSWGASLIAITSIINYKLIINSKYNKETKILAVAFIVFGLFWSQSFDRIIEFNSVEIALKYSLATLSLLYLANKKINFSSVRLGFLLAGFSAAPIAIYQFQNNGRAEGFTNAIQFGDIAIFISFGCFIFSISKANSIAMRSMLVLSSMSAFMVSILSLSRGGWLFLLLFPVAAYFLVEDKTRYWKMAALFFLSISIFFSIALKNNLIKERLNASKDQLSDYINNPAEHATTSVGQRLEQWQLAWKLGKERPVSGWGDQGLIAAKQSIVDHGQADPSVMDYGHAHNEWMDNWARRGSIGILFLLAIYSLPFGIFFPTKKRLANAQNGAKEHLLQLRIIGAFLPIAYFIFGLSQCFFAHNSGHIFYLFCLILLWSSILGLEKKGGTAPPPLRTQQLP